jgi:hypothetical protein
MQMTPQQQQAYMQQQQAQFQMMMMQQQMMAQQQQQMNPSDPAAQQYAAAMAAQHHAYATIKHLIPLSHVDDSLSNRYVQAMYMQAHGMQPPLSPFPAPSSSSPHSFM